MAKRTGRKRTHQVQVQVQLSNKTNPYIIHKCHQLYLDLDLKMECSVLQRIHHQISL